MTKDSEFKKQLEAIPDYKLLEMAREELSKLTQSGGKSFTMSVPPQVSDTDILFNELIRRFEMVAIDRFTINYEL